MVIVKYTIPIRPKVVPLAVFTHSVFLIRSTLSEIFTKRCYEIQDLVVLVLNSAIIGSQS